MLRLNTGGEGGKKRTAADDTADVRDILSTLVGRGVTNLSDGDTRADYQRLMKLLGSQKANKVLTQVLAHNSRSSSVPVEKRVQDFYEIGSNDPEVADVLKSVKTFGYGVLPGFREQGRQYLQELTQRVDPNAASGADSGNMQRQIMLRLQK